MLSVNKLLYHIHTPNCLIFHFIRMAVHIHPKRINLTANSFAILLQSNLSVADMLYSGYLVIADIFSQNWPNHGQTVKEKLPYSAHFQLLQRTQFVWYGVKSLSQIYLFKTALYIFCGKIKINYYLISNSFHLIHFSTFTLVGYLISLKLS